MKWLIRIAGGLALVLTMGVAILLIMGQRANAGHAHASVEIAASPEQIWPYLTDGGKFRQWVNWVVDVRGENYGLGATRVVVMKDENNGGQYMEITGKCTEYAPPTQLATHLSAGDLFDGEQRYRLVALGNGRTRMDVDMRYRFASWLARLMEPVITPQAEKKMVGDMARLKSLVEGSLQSRVGNAVAP